MSNLQKFKDIIEDKIEIIKGANLDESLNDEPIEFLSLLVELNTNIFTVLQFTDLTQNELENYIYNETGLTLDDLQQLENSLY